MPSTAVPTPTRSRSATLFAADVARSPAAQPRQLPSKYFYDELGSALFEAICRLPWYRITRAESALLARYAQRDPVGRCGGRSSLAELGCGSGDKLVALLAARRARACPLHPADRHLSRAALEMARYRLQAIGLHDMLLTHRRRMRTAWRARSRSVRATAPLLVLFLGSNIGNFDRRRPHASC